jgi:hypothetical protein
VSGIFSTELGTLKNAEQHHQRGQQDIQHLTSGSKLVLCHESTSESVSPFVADVALLSRFVGTSVFELETSSSQDVRSMLPPLRPLSLHDAAGPKRNLIFVENRTSSSINAARMLTISCLQFEPIIQTLAPSQWRS